jgi:hypothetical protein
MNLPFDSYERRAHLGPAVLAAAPAIVLCVSLLPSLESVGAILAFLFSAVLVIICTAIRGLGRNLEAGLWSAWGGAPTTQLLRWRGKASATEQTRRHKLLQGIVGEPLPTWADEEANPEESDARYKTATTALRQLTREGPEFELVRRQNADYGMRRNCLGLRPIALAVASIVLTLSVILFITHGEVWHFWLPASASAVALAVWWFFVNGEWVRSAADLYAVRLMETIETLAAAGVEGTAGGARAH